MMDNADKFEVHTPLRRVLAGAPECLDEDL